LQGILLEREEDRCIRMLAAGILGEIGSGGASDVLSDMLSKDEDPRIKIEALIALGKIRETEAMHLMKQTVQDTEPPAEIAETETAESPEEQSSEEESAEPTVEQQAPADQSEEQW